MPDGILYCISLYLSMCFRVQSRTPAAFKTKLCNKIQQQFPAIAYFFSQRAQQHITRSTKILIGIRGYPPAPMINCNLGKI